MLIFNLYIYYVFLIRSDYGEEKPSIVKKKRRRKKKGKKHKPFKVKDFKKLKKFMLPLLLAYKLKFFTLVPLMLGGLVLIVATTGFAGFFFALFAVGLGLKGHHWPDISQSTSTYFNRVFALHRGNPIIRGQIIKSV